MDVLFRAAAVCVVGCILSLTIKKQTPELSLLLSVTSGMAGCVFALKILGELLTALREVAEKAGLSDMLLRPVLKCLAISLVTEFAVRFCRDAGQSAAAAFMEFCGTLCALYAAMPLILSLFDSVASLL